MRCTTCKHTFDEMNISYFKLFFSPESVLKDIFPDSKKKCLLYGFNQGSSAARQPPVSLKEINFYNFNDQMKVKTWPNYNKSPFLNKIFNAFKRLSIWGYVAAFPWLSSPGFNSIVKLVKCLKFKIPWTPN